MKKIFMLLLLHLSTLTLATDYSAKKSELDSIFDRLSGQAKWERRAEGVALLSMATVSGIIATQSYNNTERTGDNWGSLVIGLGTLGWGAQRFFVTSHTEDEIKDYREQQESSDIHIQSKVKRGEELLEYLAEREKQNRYEKAALSGLATIACYHATNFKERHNQNHQDVRLGSYFFLLLTAKYLFIPTAAERAFKNYTENQKESSVSLNFDLTPIYKGTMAQVTLNF